MVWLLVFGIVNVRTDVDACDCADTERESALKDDYGISKLPCLTGESNPRQYCAWPFGPTLYPLSDPRPRLMQALSCSLNLNCVAFYSGKQVWVNQDSAK